MATRRRHWPARIALGAAIAVTCLCLLAATLLATPLGTRIAVAVATPRLPAGITFDRVTGPVRGPLVVYNLRLVNPAADVAIGRISLDWRLRGLLFRTVVVDAVAIEDVDVRLSAVEAEEPAPAEPVGPLPALRFPLQVRIEDGRIDRVTITPVDSAAAPWVVDSVRVIATLERDGVDIERLTASGPDLDLELAVDVTTAGAYPVSGSAAWRLLLPDSLHASGHGTFDGEIDGELAIHHSLSAPILATVDAVLADARRGLRLDALLTLPDQVVADIVEGWPVFGIGGALESRGALDSLRVRGNLRADAAPVGRFVAEFAVLRSADTLKIDAVDIHRPGRPGAILASGSVVLDTVPGFDLAMQWRDLQWPLDDSAVARSSSGRLAARGTPDEYRLTMGGSADAGPLEGVRFALTATGSREAAHVQQLRAWLLAGEVTTSGDIAWSPEPEWRLSAEARGLRPDALMAQVADWPGTLDIDFVTSGRTLAGRTEGRLDISRMAGSVRDEPIAGRLTADFVIPAHESAAPTLVIDTAWVDWSTLRLRAVGRVDDRIDVRFALDAPDLSVAAPGVSGSLRLAGEAGGTPQLPLLRATARVDSVAFRETARVAGASFDVEVGAAADAPIRIAGRARDIVAGGTSIDSVELDADGVRDAHSIRLHLHAPDSTKAMLVASGGLIGSQWAGVLERLDLSAPTPGVWFLERPAAVTAGATTVSVDSLCLASGPALVCAAATWTAGGEANGSLRLSNLSLERFRSAFPAGWEASGEVSADASMRVAAAGDLTGEVRAVAVDGRMSFPVGDTRDTLTLAVASLQGRIGRGGASAHAEFGLGRGDTTGVARMIADLALPDFTRLGDSITAQPIEGRLSGEITDFSIVEATTAMIDSVAGRLTLDATVSGTVGSPVVNGGLNLAGGRAVLPELGLQLTDLRAGARGEGEDRIRFEASGRSGAGTFELTGESPLAPSADSPARLRITGDRVLAMNTPEIRVRVSPALDVTATRERIEVSGEVRVPRADIELTEIPETAVPPSPDVIFVGDTAASVIGPEIDARVRVVLGDSVSFSGFGFAARPVGSLLVVEQPGQVTTGTGEISVTGGRFRAYGQDLTLERGRVLFGGGPVADPGLDMRAVRRARDGTVAGLDIGGTLKQPDVQLFSEPAMTQSEALAYLILGRPLGQASSSEGDRLTNAATSLGLRGGNLLASRIGARFGFEEVRIETEDNRLEEASLVAGRYLTPRLYVAYGIGLFRPVSTYRIQYLLSGRWTLQAESGDQTGADLLYRLERGR